jgi:hypothetical protein
MIDGFPFGIPGWPEIWASTPPPTQEKERKDETGKGNCQKRTVGKRKEKKDTQKKKKKEKKGTEKKVGNYIDTQEPTSHF